MFNCINSAYVNLVFQIGDLALPLQFKVVVLLVTKTNSVAFEIF